MAWKRIEIICKDCKGEGILHFPDNPDQECADCGGKGYKEWGRMWDPKKE